jgi:uncharacterized protein DUF1236
MRSLLLTTASLALVASAGLASAQPHERGGGPGGPAGGMHAPGGPPPSGGMHNPGGQAPGGAQGPHGELKGPHGYGPEPGNRAETPRQQHMEPGRRAEPERQRTEPNRRAEPERKAEPNRRAEPQHRPEQQRATEQQRRATEEKNRADRQREERNAERDRGAREQKGAEERRGEERRPDRERVGERNREIEQARTRLSMQDREKLHRSFDFEHARVSRVDFDYHVGHRVPGHVHLFPVPREVIGFFPYYREYSYFVVGDEICIVNPATYEVVDVIDQGYWRGPGRIVAGLHLSSAQSALVRDSIPRDFPEANLRLRLALGAEIPDDVELYDFPRIVVDRVPELREFRFLVTDEQIVIIDPHDRSIAVMVDRA